MFKTIFFNSIDIGYLFIKIVLLNLNLEICQIDKIPFDKEATPIKTVTFIQKSITKFLKSEKIANDEVLGIGLGILPRYDRETFYLENCDQFSDLGWTEFNIKKELEQATGYSVFVESGMNLSALAEYRKNYFGDFNSLLFISNDVTLKSAAIINGKFAYQQDGEIDGMSHMIIDIKGNLCSCGATGCLGTYCTLPVYQQNLIDKTTAELQNDIRKLSYLDLIEKIDKEDIFFVEEKEKCAYFFAIGVSNMILQLHPDIVILGGSLGVRMDQKVNEIVTQRLAPFDLINQTKINVMNNEFNSVSQGAGCLVFDYFIEEENSL